MTLSLDQIQPVVVTAPTARNGITLLQRLLNSSGQIIVYGENKHLCELMPSVVYAAHGVHASSHKEMEQTRQRFLNETTDFWSSNLWPDTRAYVEQSVEAFRGYVRFYQACSERYGFKRWGIKHPFSSVTDFDRFTTLLPSGRFIYVYRDLFAVARSSKARKFATTPAQFETLAANWCASLKVVLASRVANLLVIKYEELLQDPKEWISRIESFTGITSVNPDVMNKKYNTFRGDIKKGYSPTEYIPPEPLTEEEEAILRENAADMLASQNYTDQTAPQAVAAPA